MTLQADSQTLQQIVQVFAIVQREDPQLLPIARWLFAASQIATAQIEGMAPTTADLRALHRLLRQQVPEMGSFIGYLAEKSVTLETLATEILLDLLCENSTWNHPAEVTKNPPLVALLDACRARLLFPGQPRARLLQVRTRLEHALQISETARNRRQRAQVQDGNAAGTP